MRRMKLVAAVLMAGGLVFAASSTALAVGHDTRPAEAAPTATTVTRATVEPKTEPGERATQAADDVTEPATKRSATRSATDPVTEPVQTARPARPVPANPDFTG